MGDTTIEWANKTWNCLRGCSLVSAGCKNCYAMKIAGRFSGPGLAYEGLVVMGNNGARWTGKVDLVEKHLTDPLRWRKPQRVFVNSMSDLFHESVPDEWIDKIFAVMALCPHLVFQILTKRPDRMREYLDEYREERIREEVAFSANNWGAWKHAEALGGVWEPEQRGEFGRIELQGYFDDVAFPWPLPNVWLGISAEDQATANERIPLLLQTPAAVRWVSAEPLISHLDLLNWLPSIHKPEANHDNGRNEISRIGSAGLVLDRQRGEDLATRDIPRRRDIGADPIAGTVASGAEFVGEGQVSTGDVRSRGRASEGECASHRLDGDERSPNPERNGDQPYRRQQTEQSPFELGAGNEIGKRNPRHSSAGSEAEGASGGGECFSSIERCPGDRDSNPVAQQGDVATGDRGAVRGEASHDQQHRERPHLETPAIDWLVVGGESGPGARPMHPQWARDLRDQCVAASVPYFFKQWGNWAPYGECDDPCGKCIHAFPDGAITGTDWVAGSHLRGSTEMHPVGKKAAGRLLDGVEWNQYPARQPEVVDA